MDQPRFCAVTFLLPASSVCCIACHVMKLIRLQQRRHLNTETMNTPVTPLFSSQLTMYRGMGPFIRPSVRPPIRMYPHSQRRSMPSDELLPAKTTQAILQIFIYLSATGASSFREKGPRRPPAKSGLLQKVRTCGSTHLIRADYDLQILHELAYTHIYSACNTVFVCYS